MKRTMTKILVMLVALSVFIPLSAFAAPVTVQGTVTSFFSIETGKPDLDAKDPRLAYLNTFVIVTPDKKQFYVPGVDRKVLAANIGKTVRVTGDLQDKYDSIKTKTVEVQKGNAWNTVWSWNGLP